MRTALFVLGMLINTGLQTLAESNGLELEYSDSLTMFIVVMFIAFCVMDIVEFIEKTLNPQK